MHRTNPFIVAFILIIGAAHFQKSAKTEIKKNEGRYVLYYNGTPFYIKGAGGYENFDQLKKAGGNSLRIWSTDYALKYLDKAQELGLRVTLGIYMKPERHGFNYSDKKAVGNQFEAIKAQVLAFKDHPALLAWGVGNELDIFAMNYEVWDAVNDVVKFIHANDPDHVATTMLAGVNQDHLREIQKRCPDLDFISINAFKDLPYVKSKLDKAGWTGPYLISEWGATGYWESDTVPWGAFIEETSTEKAKVCEERYKAIRADSAHCIGSYIYYWGSKQERTHTLLSLFLPHGEELETVNVMRKMWTGQAPANRAPSITPLHIDYENPKRGIYLHPGSQHTAHAGAKDPDGEKLLYRWELYKENTEHKQGGDTETKLVRVDNFITGQKEKQITFKAPLNEGPYRLFVYAFDGDNHVATANAPFYVRKSKP